MGLRTATAHPGLHAAAHKVLHAQQQWKVLVQLPQVHHLLSGSPVATHQGDCNVPANWSLVQLQLLRLVLAARPAIKGKGPLL